MSKITSINNIDYISYITMLVRKDVMDNISNSGACSILLTGGRTAELLYRYWSESCPWDHKEVIYYFGDERCVPSDSRFSNYAMVADTLLPNGINQNISLNKMNGDADDILFETRRYEKLLPDEIDILLFSVGEDGHIASLFPGSDALYEHEHSVVPIIGPKPPQNRLTITPRVINSAKSIFVFASGAEKGKILAKALDDHDNVNELPVRLTIGATWILDEAATAAFKESAQHNHLNTRIIYA